MCEGKGYVCVGGGGEGRGDRVWVGGVCILIYSLLLLSVSGKKIATFLQLHLKYNAKPKSAILYINKSSTFKCYKKNKVLWNIHLTSTTTITNKSNNYIKDNNN